MDSSDVTFWIGLLLAVPLWLLYHKLFRVIYFGNPFTHMAGELGSALITGWVLATAIAAILDEVAMWLLTVFKYVLLATIPLAILWGILFLRFLRREGIHLLRKGEIPALHAPPVLEAGGRLLAFSHWKMAYVIYQNRFLAKLIVVTVLLCAVGAVLVLLFDVGQRLMANVRVAAATRFTTNQAEGQAQTPPPQETVTSVTVSCGGSKGRFARKFK